MDLIYKIGEFYLYDNQFNWDYLILYNRRPTQNQDVLSPEGEYYDDVEYKFNSDLPFEFNWSDGVFNQIFRNANDIEIDSKSIQLMSETCKELGLPFIKISEPGILNFVKKSGTHIPNYNAYHIYFNETLAGIDITEYELAAHWEIGKTGYSTIRLFEFVHCREESIDVLNLQKQ